MTENEQGYPTAGDPYVGSPSLHRLDETIVAALAANRAIAEATHVVELTDLQRAACQLIPSGLSLALSIRELLREAYLYDALVLERPLAERAVTCMYLFENQSALELWKRGWSHRERPTFAKMLDALDDIDAPQFFGRDVAKPMNSLVHGDPDSSIWNLVVRPDGSMGHAVARILNRPDLCDLAASNTDRWLAMFIGMMCACFPEQMRSTDPA
jgi:hypothetical protein